MSRSCGILYADRRPAGTTTVTHETWGEPGGRTKALEWMRRSGYDPADYEIIYVTG